MKVLICLFVLCFSIPCFASDLCWDYPIDYDTLSGWVVYWESPKDGTYNFVISKWEVVWNGWDTLYYRDIERQLGLLPNTWYNIWLTAFNQYGESGPSNIVRFKTPRVRRK